MGRNVTPLAMRHPRGWILQDVAARLAYRIPPPSHVPRPQRTGSRFNLRDHPGPDRERNTGDSLYSPRSRPRHPRRPPLLGCGSLTSADRHRRRPASTRPYARRRAPLASIASTGTSSSARNRARRDTGCGVRTPGRCCPARALRRDRKRVGGGTPGGVAPGISCLPHPGTGIGFRRGDRRDVEPRPGHAVRSRRAGSSACAATGPARIAEPRGVAASRGQPWR
jgi:hypothetical protein